MEIIDFTLGFFLDTPKPFGRIDIVFKDGSRERIDLEPSLYSIIIQMLKIDTLFYDKVQGIFFTRHGENDNFLSFNKHQQGHFTSVKLSDLTDES